jgi:putative SOS response-associated peptidase YedK
MAAPNDRASAIIEAGSCRSPSRFPRTRYPKLCSMCDRLTLPEQRAAERELQPTHAWWKFAVRFNVSAQQYLAAVRVHQRESEGVMLRWGLIPSWAQGQAPAAPPTSIAADQVARSSVHQGAWRSGQRCILPIGGFYAWRLTAAGYRQPYFVRSVNRSVIGVAAVWDRWVDEHDDVIESCSIVCVLANELMREVTNTSRHMPAILRRKDYDTWLHGTPDDARSTLVPYRSEWMHAYQVSPRINSHAPDDPGLIRPAA